ncbi:hypothetical protein SCHPADRAFT_915583 [Schizopora paradoxa]|uniref:Yeast cell wall synthesis Kre9/Knh1-like N-terminal domain-containing protein n=1 Tax=Schizopora paradoxa TaxID=27342 RepID=A0A0H2RL89_9AGAM|nr:hypothetical protein SCHPADRAFT_915583 [Schizopora paradoxa]
MIFAKTVLASLALATSALGITITSPSPSQFWVQNTSNVISWSFNNGDPNPIDITVSNPNSSALQGNFSIAQFVRLDNGSFTVTNVTLKVASGYVINFVNSSNENQIFASSQAFDVDAPGTPPATSSAASSSSTATSPANSSASGTGTGANGSATSSSAAGHAVAFDFPVYPVLASAGMALVGALVAL